MKALYNWVGISLVICLLGFVSCDKNEGIDLVDTSYKTLNVSCGYDFEVPVLTNNWSIESVLYLPSGEVMLDKDGNPLALVGNGTTEASNGWLSLTRNGDDKFVINLKENFDSSNERKFVICIKSEGYSDNVTVVQQAGTEYKLVKSEFKEIEEQRKVYVSDEGCSQLTLSNNTSEAVWEPCDYIFENVVESSDFESDDYGAFDWIPKEGSGISMPELMIDNAIRWGGICVYKKGITTTPYIKNITKGNKILVQPYSTISLRGKITYCKRVYSYSFTIQNVGTGTQFKITGIWRQIVPISSHAISS
jgi:hypothetical protein